MLSKKSALARIRLQNLAEILPAALCICAIFMGATLLVWASDAHALRVTVKRIVFEDAVRSEIITIINNTTEEKIYRLGWRPMRMTETQALQYLGDQDPADVDGLRPAADMIRYAPRRVVMAPGSSQKVRLLLRRPRDLAPGEYRSHFWIQPEAEAVKFDERQENSDKPTVELKMLTGLTMPVIVRAGKLDVTADIRGLEANLENGTMKVSMTMHREGNRSLYGDMKFFCDGDLVHEVRGIAVYTEVDRRTLNFNVSLTDDVQQCRTLSVQYIAPEDDKLFRGDVMAEASATL